MLFTSEIIHWYGQQYKTASETKPDSSLEKKSNQNKLLRFMEDLLLDKRVENEVFQFLFIHLWIIPDSNSLNNTE